MIDFKGVVKLTIVDKRTDKIKFVHEQENVFFNQGLKNIINNQSRVLCITDSSTPLTINSNALDGIVMSQSAPNIRTYDHDDMGHTFIANFAPPTTGTRTTRAVALAGNTLGQLAWAGTVLTTPVNQLDEFSVLWIHYTIFVQLPVQGGGSGFWGGSIRERIAPNIFSNLYSTQMSNLMHMNSFVGNPDESNVNWVPMSSLIDISSNSTIKDPDRYRIFHKNTLGTAANRTIGANMYGSRGFGPWNNISQFLPYNKAMISRVWAKNKSSNSIFFDSMNLPIGYDRAVEVKEKTHPYVMTGIPRLVLNAVIGSVGGAVGTATYKLASYTNYNTKSIEMNQSHIAGFVGHSWARWAIGIFDRGNFQYIVHHNTHQHRLYITCLDNNVVYEFSNSCKDSTYQSVGDILWLLDNNHNTIHKLPLSINFGDSVITNSYTHPTKQLLRILFILGKIWCETSDRTGWIIFDPITELWTDSVINRSNYGILFNDGEGSSYHDIVNGRLFSRRSGSLFYVNTNLTNAINVVVPYFDDFNDGIMKNWGFHNTNLWGLRGNIKEINGELQLLSGQGHWTNTVNTVTQVGHYLMSGDFEITTHITNFDPPTTRTSVEAGMFVMGIETGGGTKSIGSYILSSGVRMIRTLSSTTGHRAVEASATLNLTSFRLKITRVNNNIECFYSDSLITISDVNAVWISLGNPYTHLTGKVIVGLYNSNSNSITQQWPCHYGEYRINSGIVDQQVAVLPVTEGVREKSRSSLNVNNTVTNCIAYTDNTYFVVDKRNGGITKINSLTFEQTILSNVFFNTSSLSQVSAYQGIGVVIYNIGLNNVWFLMDGGVNWNWANVICLIAFVTKWGVIIVRNSESVTLSIFGEWGWDGVKWIYGHEGEKITHIDWQDTAIGDLQIRFNPRPGSPSTTIDVNDRYDFQAMVGVIKDNEQILQDFGAASYLGIFGEINNELRSPPYTIDPSGARTLLVNATNIPGFLSCDFEVKEKLFFKSGGNFIYWDTIIANLSVTSISVATSTFNDIANQELSLSWNVYKGMFIKFTSGLNTGVRREIIEYDGFYKQFITLPFLNTINIGDNFLIEIPSVAKHQENFIPDMSSNISIPPFIVSASVNTINAWKVFDRSTENWHFSSPVGQWLMIDLGSEQKFVFFTLNQYSTGAVKTFRIEGANILGTWINLSGTRNAKNQTGKQIYSFSNPNAYRYYRFVIESVYGTWVQIFNFEFMLFNSYLTDDPEGRVYISEDSDLNISYGYIKRG